MSDKEIMNWPSLFTFADRNAQNEGDTDGPVFGLHSNNKLQQQYMDRLREVAMFRGYAGSK